MILMVNGQQQSVSTPTDNLTRAVIISLFTWRRADPDDDRPGHNLHTPPDTEVGPAGLVDDCHRMAQIAQIVAQHFHLRTFTAPITAFHHEVIPGTCAHL